MAIAFLGIGHVQQRLGSCLQPDRLVIEHPVGDIIVAFLDQQIRRVPSFGQSWTEPAARRRAGSFGDHRAGLANVGALVLDLLHVPLGEAVAHELPAAIARGPHDRGISSERRAIDRQHRAD